MIRDSHLRRILWLTVVFNVAAASVFLFPSSLGQLAGLPVPVAPLYTMLLAFFVLLFAAAYAWLALAREIDRPMIAMAAIGKAGVFVIAITLWAAGQGPGWFVPGATGDLVFAILFLVWLRSGAKARPA